MMVFNMALYSMVLRLLAMKAASRTKGSLASVGAAQANTKKADLGREQHSEFFLGQPNIFDDLFEKRSDDVAGVQGGGGRLRGVGLSPEAVGRIRWTPRSFSS